MIDLLIISLAGAARYLQANGHAGPGRWLLLPVMIAAGWYGPLDSVHLSIPETANIMAMAVAGWATVAFGYTDWGNWKYSIARYSLPLIPPTITAAHFTSNPELFKYVIAGPILAWIYYYVAEHKPAWLMQLTDRDIAAALAGATVGSFVLF